MSQDRPEIAADNPRWTRGALRPAGRILVYILVLALISLTLTQLLMVRNHVLRVLLNLLAFGGGWFLLYAEGGARGQKEVAHARMLAQRGQPAPEQGGPVGRYHPMRGILPSLAVALPFLLAAIALAVLAEPYTYVLQDLPSWTAGYFDRGDLGAPLAYYAAQTGMSAADFLRIGVRLVIMPAAYIAGGFGDAASLLLDRLSPLLVLLLPMAYAVGYLRGEAMDRRLQAMYEQAKVEHGKKVARKKKRERQRQSEGKGPQRLI